MPNIVLFWINEAIAPITHNIMRKYSNTNIHIGIIFEELFSSSISVFHKDEMLVKLPKMEDFHDSSFCSNAMVSTCMVCGNMSTGWISLIS